MSTILRGGSSLRLALMRLIAVLAFAAPAVLAQTTTTGHIATPSGNPNYRNTVVHFQLLYCGSNQPKVNGVSLFGGTSFDAKVDSSGNVKDELGAALVLSGNDIITCGTTLGGTRWQWQVVSNGAPGPSCRQNITGASWDLTSNACDNASPAPTPPAAVDATYLRKDLQNVPVSGDFTPDGNGTRSLGNSAAQWNASLATATGKSVNGRLFVGTGGYASVTAALAALPSAGGRIEVDSAATTLGTITCNKPAHIYLGAATYTTTGITFSKACIIEGVSADTTTVQYTPTTGKGLTISLSATPDAPGMGLRNLRFNHGNTSDVVTGISIEGAHDNASALFDHIQLDNFKTCLDVSTGAGGFTTIRGTAITGCGQLLNISASALEKFVIDDSHLTSSTTYAAGVYINSPVEVRIARSSMDYTQLVVGAGAVGAQISIADTYMECNLIVCGAASQITQAAGNVQLNGAKVNFVAVRRSGLVHADRRETLHHRRRFLIQRDGFQGRQRGQRYDPELLPSADTVRLGGVLHGRLDHGTE
jgi:hypothetical protein